MASSRIEEAKLPGGYLVTPRVPQGLAAAVEGLTREVIRNSPEDIYVFAAHHFEKLLELREECGLAGGESSSNMEGKRNNTLMEMSRALRMREIDREHARGTRKAVDQVGWSLNQTAKVLKRHRSIFGDESRRITTEQVFIMGNEKNEDSQSKSSKKKTSSKKSGDLWKGSTSRTEDSRSNEDSTENASSKKSERVRASPKIITQMSSLSSSGGNVLLAKDIKSELRKNRISSRDRRSLRARDEEKNVAEEKSENKAAKSSSKKAEKQKKMEVESGEKRSRKNVDSTRSSRARQHEKSRGEYSPKKRNEEKLKKSCAPGMDRVKDYVVEKFATTRTIEELQSANYVEKVQEIIDETGPIISEKIEKLKSGVMARSERSCRLARGVPVRGSKEAAAEISGSENSSSDVLRSRLTETEKLMEKVSSSLGRSLRRSRSARSSRRPIEGSELPEESRNSLMETSDENLAKGRDSMEGTSCSSLSRQMRRSRSAKSLRKCGERSEDGGAGSKDALRDRLNETRNLLRGISASFGNSFEKSSKKPESQDSTFSEDQPSSNSSLPAVRSMTLRNASGSVSRSDSDNLVLPAISPEAPKSSKTRENLILPVLSPPGTASTNDANDDAPRPEDFDISEMPLEDYVSEIPLENLSRDSLNVTPDFESIPQRPDSLEPSNDLEADPSGEEHVEETSQLSRQLENDALQVADLETTSSVTNDLEADPSEAEHVEETSQLGNQLGNDALQAADLETTLSVTNDLEADLSEEEHVEETSQLGNQLGNDASQAADLETTLSPTNDPEAAPSEEENVEETSQLGNQLGNDALQAADLETTLSVTTDLAKDSADDKDVEEEIQTQVRNEFSEAGDLEPPEVVDLPTKISGKPADSEQHETTPDDLESRLQEIQRVEKNIEQALEPKTTTISSPSAGASNMLEKLRELEDAEKKIDEMFDLENRKTGGSSPENIDEVGTEEELELQVAGSENSSNQFRNISPEALNYTYVLTEGSPYEIPDTVTTVIIPEKRSVSPSASIEPEAEEEKYFIDTEATNERVGQETVDSEDEKLSPETNGLTDPFGELVKPEATIAENSPEIEFIQEMQVLQIPHQDLGPINEEVSEELEDLTDKPEAMLETLRNIEKLEKDEIALEVEEIDKEEEEEVKKTLITVDESKLVESDLSPEATRPNIDSESSNETKESGAAIDEPLESAKCDNSMDEVSSATRTPESSNEIKETTLTDALSLSLDPTRPFVPELNLDSLQDISVSSFKITEDDFELQERQTENTNSITDTLTSDENNRNNGELVEELVALENLSPSPSKSNEVSSRESDQILEEPIVKSRVEIKEEICEKATAYVTGPNEEEKNGEEAKIERLETKIKREEAKEEGKGLEDSNEPEKEETEEKEKEAQAEEAEKSPREVSQHQEIEETERESASEGSKDSPRTTPTDLAILEAKQEEKSPEIPENTETPNSEKEEGSESQKKITTKPDGSLRTENSTSEVSKVEENDDHLSREKEMSIETREVVQKDESNEKEEVVAQASEEMDSEKDEKPESPRTEEKDTGNEEKIVDAIENSSKEKEISKNLDGEAKQDPRQVVSSENLIDGMDGEESEDVLEESLVEEETPLAVSRSASQCTTRRVSSGNLAKLREDHTLSWTEEIEQEDENKIENDASCSKVTFSGVTNETTNEKASKENDVTKMTVVSPSDVNNEMTGSQTTKDKEYHIYVPEVDASEDCSTTESSTFDSAVTKIQAGVRGFLTRRRLLRGLQNRSSTLSGIPSIQDSMAIEPDWVDDRVLEASEEEIPRPEETRISSEKSLDDNLVDAATRIQSNYRGYKARKRLRREDAVQRTTFSLEKSFAESGLQHTGEFHDCIPLPIHDITTDKKPSDSAKATSPQEIEPSIPLEPPKMFFGNSANAPLIQFNVRPNASHLIDLVVVAKEDAALQSGYLNFITSVEDAEPIIAHAEASPQNLTVEQANSSDSLREPLALSDPPIGLVLEEVTSSSIGESLPKIEEENDLKTQSPKSAATAPEMVAESSVDGDPTPRDTWNKSEIEQQQTEVLEVTNHQPESEEKKLDKAIANESESSSMMNFPSSAMGQSSIKAENEFLGPESSVDSMECPDVQTQNKITSCSPRTSTNQEREDPEASIPYSPQRDFSDRSQKSERKDKEDSMDSNMDDSLPSKLSFSLKVEDLLDDLGSEGGIDVQGKKPFLEVTLKPTDLMKSMSLSQESQLAGERMESPVTMIQIAPGRSESLKQEEEELSEKVDDQVKEKQEKMSPLSNSPKLDEK